MPSRVTTSGASLTHSFRIVGLVQDVVGRRREDRAAPELVRVLADEVGAKTKPAKTAPTASRQQRHQHDPRAFVRLVIMAVAMTMIVVCMSVVHRLGRHHGHRSLS